MKYKAAFLTMLFLSLTLNAEKYYIRHLDGKNIVIINENHEIVSYSLKNFLEEINNGDTLLFKRGEYFKTPVEIKNKKNIIIKDYGSQKLPMPIIDPRVKIPFKNFEEIELSNQKLLTKDKSLISLKNIFTKNRAVLATHIRNKTVKNITEVKKHIHKIFRIKIGKNIEKNTLRIWINNQEILKALIFEELKCENCKEKIRWAFENENGYLYIFVLDPSVSLAENSFIKINAVTLDTISLTNDENITLKNIDIRGSKYALGIRGSKNILIENCNIGKYSFTAIDIMRSLENRRKYSENITVKNCLIDSGFNKKYRYLSSRGVQDAIFMVDGVKNCNISNNKITNWGHSGINLYAPLFKEEVKNNKISHNTIDGKDISYMHGITVDGEHCIENEISSNLIKNITARNQLNGIKNIFRKNIVYNVKNSIVKIDQGYPCGQGIQIQAYGKDNLALENLIEENVFTKIEGAAISIINYKNDGIKKRNIFKNNFITKSGLRNKNVALEILNFSEINNIKENFFINNTFKVDFQEPKINYFGKILSIEEFNEEQKNFIKDNKILY